MAQWASRVFCHVNQGELLCLEAEVTEDGRSVVVVVVVAVEVVVSQKAGGDAGGLYLLCALSATGVKVSTIVKETLMLHRHNLSHYKLLTGDMGELYPVSCVEVLPGDIFRHKTNALIRFSPLVSPVMHPVRINFDHWFVPTRLLDSNWEAFITGGEDGLDNTTLPTVTVPTPASNGPLLDYLGVPPIAGQAVIAYPVRAYNKIFNEFYRDQDLVTAVAEDSLTLQRVAWPKDYFTSARPWAQKGPAVTLPLGTSAPITGIGKATGVYQSSSVGAKEAGGNDETYTKWQVVDESTGDKQFRVEEDPNNLGYPNLYADLTNATAASIIDLREAIALQRFMELRARTGGRYAEYLRAAFKVAPQDSRLQRPERLGGGKRTASFSEVLYTAEGASNPVGHMVGHGISAAGSRRYRRHFQEHGFVLTLMFVRPVSIYGQGLHRKFSRLVKEDYYQKELEMIGAQEVQDQEVWCDATAPVTFGYQERYREYKEEPSTVHGEFRTTLNHWHISREFASMPALNQTFTDCNPRKDIHADTASHGLYAFVNHSIQALRLVTRRGAVGSFR